ncbi:ribosomal protein L1-like protein [Aspergillus pseudoustus]|uniref:Ribosomal protein L1-like protein n=1 Tax=Aspergillus pseudoustus TaxID=1810923 RepID=A0ABR4ISR5_9EURO
MSSIKSLMPSGARTMLSICRPPLRQGSMAAPLFGYQQVRGKASASQQKTKKFKEKGKVEKKKKGPKNYDQIDLSQMMQFSLCDAMRYIRAFEAGRSPEATKYEVHIRLKSKRDGPVIRNMIRFPHSVQTESRICVICPPNSRIAKEALAAGAVLVGEEEVFEAVKNGRIEFDRCLCHPDSVDAMNKAGMGRILGPRGLMPNAKMGTIVEDVASRVEDLRGGTVYRERDAVVRLAIGQLAFSPEQLRDNLRTVVDQVKKDASAITDKFTKEVYEVVLSSTHGPGLSLTGDFTSDSSPDPAVLTGA